MKLEKRDLLQCYSLKLIRACIVQKKPGVLLTRILDSLHFTLELY